MSIAARLKGLFGHRPSAMQGTEAPEMISCEEAMAALYEYLDGELVGISHDRVKAHFDMCARCYPRLRVEESFRLAIRKAARQEKPSPALRNKVKDALARAKEATRGG